MRTLRIFISSPGDVTKERERAREVVESLRRRFARHFLLQAVLWEDLPLQSDMSFQRGIDAVLSEKGVDIAIFILWSRLGTPLGPAIPRPDGTPYLSGTEREFDLIMQARATSVEKEGTARPAVLVYTRRDDASFEEALRGTSTEKKEELIEQKKRVEFFLAETFRDKETGVNIGAYFPFDRPVTFSQRLRTHLQGLLDEMAGESTEVIWDIDKQGAPFLGLEAFQPQHAAVFFGREEEIFEARHALREQAREGCAFLLLSGASGSGKSSLARAGVLPAIVELEVDEQVSAWSSLVLTPSQLGPEPIAALVGHLADDQHLPSLAESSSSLPDLVAGLKKDPDLTFRLRLKEAFARSATKHGGSMRLLLVLDQLEEVFTASVFSPDDRAAFFAVIETFARSGSVWVLATVRSDFYEQVQNEPALVRMKKGHGQLDVLPPAPDALARIIEEPARLAGLTFERREDQTLSSRIIKDAAAHTELLPLVEFVLRELFERRDDNHLLTFASYEDLGGVEGALARRADETFASLPIEAQESLDGLLPQLISMDPAGEQNAVRRRAPLLDLCSNPARRQLTEALIAARFLTTDEQEGTAIAFLAHEALLRRWDRLKEWTDRNRDLLRLRATVEHGQSRWCAGGKDRSLLLSPGLPLEEGRRLLRDGGNLVSGSTRDYVEVSIKHWEAEEARRLRLRRGVITALSVLTVAALSGAGWATVKQREARSAEQEARSAEHKARSAEQEARSAEQEARSAEAQLERQLVETQRQMERSQLEEGRGWLARAKVAWEGRREPLTALMLAGRAVGFYGFGRVEGVASEFPDLLGKPMEDKEKENARLVEVEAVRRFVEDVRPTGLPIWSNLSNADQERISYLCVAYSPNGTQIATGSSDHSVRLWDAATGVEIATLHGHSSVVWTVAFSPDGKLVASGSVDQTIKLWNVTTGSELATLKGHSGTVRSVVFSPDGTCLTSGSDDTTVKIWDTELRKEIATLEGHKDWVLSVAYSPDGTRVVSGSEDRTVKIWDAVIGAELQPAGKQLKVDTSNRIVTWRREMQTLEGHSKDVTSVAFSPDGTKVASGSFDGTLKLWDLASGKELASIDSDSGVVLSVVFSPDGTRVAAATDYKTRFWDTTTGKELAALEGYSHLFKSVAFSPDGSRMASVSNDDTVKLWDVATGGEFAALIGHRDWVDCLAISPDGTRLASGSRDKKFKLWEIATGMEIETFEGHENRVACLAFSPDGTLVASGSSEPESTVKLWDVATGRDIKSHSGHKSGVICLAFSSDGTRVASGSTDNTATVWETTGRKVATFQGHTDFVTGVAFSPNGTGLATGSRDGTIKIWDLATGNSLVTLDGRSANVANVAFSPDGTCIVSELRDKTVKIWNIDSGKEIATLDERNSSVNSVTYYPDGNLSFPVSKYMYTSDPDGRFFAERDGHVTRIFRSNPSKMPDLYSLISGGVLRMGGSEVERSDTTLSAPGSQKFTPHHYRDDEIAALAALNLSSFESAKLRLRLMRRTCQWRAAKAWWSEEDSSTMSALRSEYLLILLTSARNRFATATPTSLAELTAEIGAVLSSESSQDTVVSSRLKEHVLLIASDPEKCPEPIWQAFVSKVIETTSGSWRAGVFAQAATICVAGDLPPESRERLDNLIELFRE